MMVEHKARTGASKKRTASRTRRPTGTPIRAVANAIDVLELVSRSGNGVGVRELARRLGLGKSTASRIILALEEAEVLRQEPETLRYVLGPRLLEVAARHRHNLEVAQVARRHLSELQQRTGETVFVGQLDGMDVVLVDQIHSDNPLRMVVEIGAREPAHCTGLGKVLLAGLDEKERRALLKTARLSRHTRQTLTSTKRLHQEIARAQAAGYAIDDQEFVEGVRCLAAPIFDSEGETVAALSVAGPALRLTDARIPFFRRAVLAAAAAVSRDLGFGSRTGARQPSKR